MAILLIPGFMLDADLWTDMRPQLDAFGPLVHADMGQDASIGAIAHRALAEAPESFAAIGFSMGGYIAREIVRLAPARVKALILIATSARADTADQTRRKTAAIENLARSPYKGVSRSAIARSLHPDRAGTVAMIDRVHDMSVRLGRETFVRQAGMTRVSDQGRLGELHCPALVIAAAQDALRSLDEAQELADGIPGACLTVIEGSGHMVPIEAPAPLACSIVPWLRRTL